MKKRLMLFGHESLFGAMRSRLVESSLEAEVFLAPVFGGVVGLLGDGVAVGGVGFEGAFPVALLALGFGLGGLEVFGTGDADVEFHFDLSLATGAGTKGGEVGDVKAHAATGAGEGDVYVRGVHTLIECIVYFFVYLKHGYEEGRI